MGQQVTHIAEDQYFFFGKFGVKPTIDPKSITALTNKDDIVKALKDSYAFAEQAIETITPQNAFEKIGDGGWGGYPRNHCSRWPGPHQRPLRADGRLLKNERNHPTSQPQIETANQ